jgi:hypothetical protein
MPEEPGLPYNVIPVNIRAGEQSRPEQARRNMFGQRAGELLGKKWPLSPSSLRGAVATKHSIPSFCGTMDCFASPARTV